MRRSSVNPRLSTIKQQPTKDPTIKADLSSIDSVSQAEHSKFEDDIDSILDLEELKMHEFYKTRDIYKMCFIGRVGDVVAKETIKYRDSM